MCLLDTNLHRNFVKQSFSAVKSERYYPLGGFKNSIKKLAPQKVLI